MKKAMVQLALVVVGIVSLHAVKFWQTSAVHEKVLPPADADRIWAIEKKDSLRMVSNNDGKGIDVRV